MNVYFKYRDFSTRTQPPGNFSVVRYSHNAFGGPKNAELRVDGGLIPLWQTLDLLRCPVQIYGDHNDLVWWGFVSAVEVSYDHLTVGIDIDRVSNNIAIAYLEKTDLGDGKISEERKTTSWLIDEKSDDEYGTKEILYTSRASSQTHAETAREMLLEHRRRPEPIPTVHDTKQPHEARIYCRGWWHTLDWQYYTNTGTDEVDTATQILAIVEDKGQFFTEVIGQPKTTDDPAVTNTLLSELETSEFMDGDGTALDEVTELLEMGTINKLQILVSVDPDRRVTVYEEPSTNAYQYLISSDGTLRDKNGSRIWPELCPVGAWAKLHDVIPAPLDEGSMADPTMIFIEESEYDALKKTLQLRPRGQVNILDLGWVRDG